VGASPPNSALLQDEPAISFLNLLANEHCHHLTMVGVSFSTRPLHRLLEGGPRATGWW
jgi:hypothetical protein